MKILLTGISGIVGRNVAQHFAEKNVPVTGITRSNVADINPNITFLRRSLLCEVDLKNIEGHFDVLIHCAAAHPSITDDSDRIILDNLNITSNLINLSEKLNIPKIIFCSSLSVFGNIKEDYVTETTELISPSIYGMSKFLSEKMFLNWAEKNGGCVINLRMPAVLGPFMNHNTFIVRLVDAFIENEQIHVFNKNNLFNNVLDIDDLCNFICHLSMTDQHSQSLVLGSNSPVALDKIIHTVGQVFPEVEIHNIVVDEQKDTFYVNPEKAKKLGFKPLDTLDTVKKYLQFKLLNKDYSHN